MPALARATKRIVADCSGASANAILAVLLLAAIVARLHAAVVKALDSTQVRAKLAAEGVSPKSSTPDAMVAHIKAEIAKWAPVIKASGVTLD